MIARIISIQISGDSNQPSCSPRSSIICNEPMPSDRLKKPNQENGTSRRVGVSLMKTQRPAVVRMPNGRLTKNTQRHEYELVSQPPSVGPMIGPSMTPMPQIAIAEPRLAGGKMSSITAWLNGTSAAPNTPCNSR